MEERLKNTFGSEAGWTVPEGYFESFRAEMLEKLPEMKVPEAAAPLGKWQRVKPYLYLAAMFAGIWMMMKVFHSVAYDSSLNLDNPPEHVAMLMEADPDLDLYAEPSYPSYEDYDGLIGSYEDMSELEKDMGLPLEPAYQNLEVETEVPKK